MRQHVVEIDQQSDREEENEKQDALYRLCQRDRGAAKRRVTHGEAGEKGAERRRQAEQSRRRSSREADAEHTERADVEILQEKFGSRKAEALDARQEHDEADQERARAEELAGDQRHADAAGMRGHRADDEKEWDHGQVLRHQDGDGELAGSGLLVIGIVHHLDGDRGR